MTCPVCRQDDSDEFAYRVTFHFSSGTVKDQKICLFPTTLEKILRKTVTVSNVPIMWLRNLSQNCQSNLEPALMQQAMSITFRIKTRS